jgi:restriction system protein
MRMNPNSLFAILLRSPWWLSIAVGGGLFAIARALLPDQLAPYGVFFAVPFFVVGTISAWRQFRAPSASRVAGTLEAVRAMDWEDFSGALEAGFRRQGYVVSRLSGTAANGADFELTRDGRVALVGCKRWKAARAGIGPLRELDNARRARDAHECIYVAAGEVSDNARAFAAANRIRLLQDNELAGLLPARTTKRKEASA